MEKRLVAEAANPTDASDPPKDAAGTLRATPGQPRKTPETSTVRLAPSEWWKYKKKTKETSESILRTSQGLARGPMVPQGPPRPHPEDLARASEHVLAGAKSTP